MEDVKDNFNYLKLVVNGSYSGGYSSFEYKYKGQKITSYYNKILINGVEMNENNTSKRYIKQFFNFFKKEAKKMGDTEEYMN